MREVRCIIFEEREVFEAVVSARRARKAPIPAGYVSRITLAEDEVVHATFFIESDKGQKIQLSIGETEIAAAMLRYLLERNVPVSQKMRKMLIVTDNQLGLVLYDADIPFRRGKAVDDLLALGNGPSEKTR